MAVTLTLALLSAVAFGWSTAAMHFATAGAPVEIRHPLSLLRHVASQWRWASGMLASLLGLGLHAAALSRGSLTVVQPIVASGLLFALLFRAGLQRRWPTRRVSWLSACIGLALAVFLLAAGSTRGSSAPSGAAAATLIVLGIAVSVVCWTVSGSHTSTSGLLLGVGTGIVFGLIAGVLKAVTDARTVGAALSNWPLWLLIGLGITGFFANQTTYRRASLASALPMVNIVNPVIALVFGIAVFRERPDSGAASYLVEAISLVAVLVGVYALARADTHESRAGDAPAGTSLTCDQTDGRRRTSGSSAWQGRQPARP